MISDEGRRRLSLGAFVAVVGLVIGALPLYAGLHDLPLMVHPHQGYQVTDHLFTLMEATTALLLVWHRPRNLVGWYLMASSLLEAVCGFGQVYATRALTLPGSPLPAGDWVCALSAPLWVPSLLLPCTCLLLRYPTGLLAGRWPRRVERGVLLGFVLLWFGYAGGDNAVSDEIKGGHTPVHLPHVLVVLLAVSSAVLLLGGLLFTFVHTVLRTWRASAPERQQLVLLVSTVPVVVVTALLPVDALGFAFMLIPVAIAVGVLRYRLMGIEVVVRRTLLYLLLTGLVLTVFVTVTSSLNALLGNGTRADVVAAFVVAIVIVPARDRLQRVVDRFVYGDSRDPWRALERLGRETASTDALTDVAAAVAESLRLPGVELHGPSGRVAHWGEIGTTTSIPLVVAGEAVGELRVSPRRGESRLPDSDERLLTTLAPMLGLVLRSTLLAQDLEVERERVITATESERARLRRDLHDGLGPSLTGIGLGLEALQSADPQRSQAILGRLRNEASASLEEVRRILDDLRPGALDAQDLLALVRSRAEHLSATTPVRVEVVAPSSLHVSPEVEAAALRIVEEALTNVVRHAQATWCTVTIENGHGLRVEVTDNGVGYEGLREGGVGVPSMRARAEALGGSVELVAPGSGTVLTARLPA